MSKTTQDFSWVPHPEANAFIESIISNCRSNNSYINDISEQMSALTGTRFFDWVEDIVLPLEESTKEKLLALGFTISDDARDMIKMEHTRALFPRIFLSSASKSRKAIRLKVEDVAFFLQVHSLPSLINGAPFSQYREAMIFEENDIELWVVERRGSTETQARQTSSDHIVNSIKVLEGFRRRRRSFPSLNEGYSYTFDLIDDAQALLPEPWVTSLWFQAEREYWMTRNTAARVQKERQDRLGLGWANHDHHTYRSSRLGFSSMIEVFERLGFFCRERFYAGEQAGWGAQVLEHTDTGIVIFADVDMSPEELQGDFSHDGFDEKDALGTIGLWCGLHGESMFEAGMHHLECEFDFEALAQQLEKEEGISMMKPFSEMTYLKQRFTEGERWEVSKDKVDVLLARKFITEKQAEKFLKEGAIGSHLENLERNDGFKGFNQTGVSEIIKKTDPREQD